MCRNRICGLVAVRGRSYRDRMARVRRGDLPDGYFHVSTRGVHGERIYRDRLDRLKFRAIRKAAFARHGIRLVSESLVDTGYHEVVEAKVEQLSRAMQELNGKYARYFNKRHRRRGHLFGERFSSWVVRGEKHMSAAIQY